jgi:hypothetical protein
VVQAALLAGGGDAAAAVAAHAPALLARPAALATALYTGAWPRLPPGDAAALDATLGLAADALRACLEQRQRGGGGGSGEEGSAGGDSAAEAAAAVPADDQTEIADPLVWRIDAAAAAASLLPLARLRELLQRAAAPLAGLDARRVIAAHVAVLLEPCLPGTDSNGGGDVDGGTGSKAGGSGDVGKEEEDAMGGAPPPGLDVDALAADAVAAIGAFVTAGGAPAAARAARLLRHLGAVAGLLEHTAPARHAALRRVLALAGRPALPALCLCCGALCARVDEGTGDGADEQEEGVAAEEAARAEAGAAAAAPHLRQLAGSQLVALALFLAGRGPQPLPEAAVGRMRPLRLAPSARAALLAAIAGVLIEGPGSGPTSPVAPSRTGADGGGGAATSAAAPAPGAAAARWLPPELPPGLPLRKRAAVSALLRAAARDAARSAVLAEAAAAGLAPRDAAAAAEAAAEFVAQGGGSCDGGGSVGGWRALGALAAQVAPLAAAGGGTEGQAAGSRGGTGGLQGLLAYLLRLRGAAEDEEEADAAAAGAVADALGDGGGGGGGGSAGGAAEALQAPDGAPQGGAEAAHEGAPDGEAPDAASPSS